MFHVGLVLIFPILLILLLLFLFSLSTENESLRETIWKLLKTVSLIMFALLALCFVYTQVISVILDKLFYHY